MYQIMFVYLVLVSSHPLCLRLLNTAHDWRAVGLIREQPDWWAASSIIPTFLTLTSTLLASVEVEGLRPRRRL